MKSGVFISAILHVLALIVLTFGLPWTAPIQPPIEQITEVTVISASEFDAAISNEPIAPLMDFTPMSAPTSESNDAARPDDAIAPTETEMDVTEAPTERDVDPDLTALEQFAQPEVAVTTAQPFVPTTPDIAPNMSSTFGSGISGNSASSTLGAPPVPRSAPRITTMAAPPSPDDTRIDTQTSDAVTPDETGTETAESTDATAVEESVTEIVPEAQPDAPPSAAPPRATVPPRRSANVARAADIAAEIARAIDEAEDAARIAAEQQEIDDLFNQALEEALVEPEVTLSGGQRAGIIEAVSRNWNKSIIIGKENYERLVITLEVRVASNGAIIDGSVKPLAPADPTGDFLVAYDAARRSVLRAEVIPIPAAQYPEGVRLELTFDPINDTAGFN